MAVTTYPIDLGTVPGDGLGDPARTGGTSINTSVANLDAAVEYLQSRGYDTRNFSDTIAIGDRMVCTAHAGITLTLPATVDFLSTTSYNDIWIFNFDTDSDVTIAPDGTDQLYLQSVGQGAGTSITLSPGYLAIIFDRETAAGSWDVAIVPITGMSLSDATDVTVTSIAADELLQWSGSAWINQTKEEADIVERDVPAIETTPYLKHETRSTRSSGTETITCADDPSVYLPIGGNNVTISLAVPSLSLPVRGLNDVALKGHVLVKMNGAYTGLGVTTTAGTKLGTFPKGTAPSASGEYAELVWLWFDDGTTDFMWAEWVNDA